MIPLFIFDATFLHILANQSNCAVEQHERFTVLFNSVAEQGKISLVVEASIFPS